MIFFLVHQKFAFNMFLLSVFNEERHSKLLRFNHSSHVFEVSIKKKHLKSVINYSDGNHIEPTKKYLPGNIAKTERKREVC